MERRRSRSLPRVSLTFRPTIQRTVAAVAFAVAACRGESPQPAATAIVPRTERAAVVAHVNGTPMTETDLALAMTAAARAENPHQTGTEAPAPPERARVLEDLIDTELAAQRAIARGLDADPGFQTELAERHAELAAFRRQRLAALLRRDLTQQRRVSDWDAQQFFAEHTNRIRTRTHIWQIRVTDRREMNAAQQELASGARFEDVAAKRTPNLATGGTPWDLGFLKWNQIPEPWQATLDTLAIGAISPVLEGPRGRLWIIKVIDRQIDSAVTFETARPAIDLVLEARAAAAAEADLARTLRASATIGLPAQR